MFFRKKKNASGSTSVQIISKASGKYKVVKTIGSATDPREIESLTFKANQEIEKLTRQPKLFGFDDDRIIESAFEKLENSSIRTVGPEIVFGKIFDHIGFNVLKQEMFRHLVIARLAFPLSKLKTAEYLYRYQGISHDINSIYRFLDKLNNQLKDQIELISYKHTYRVLKGNISVVFYDLTTLYFEASDEDDLRKTGFSKEGKHHKPQIYIGLLVGLGGYAIGYDIFEGNTYEGHTLIPFLERIRAKFNLDKPIVIADAGLLSNKNITQLQEQGYEYILGARIKNEPKGIKYQILSKTYVDKDTITIIKNSFTRLIVQFSETRAAKDAHSRKKGLTRLENRVKTGKLTKTSLNNKGYNKYLKISGEVNIEIDYEKFNQDAVWDGLKGYITNTKLTDKQVIENYSNLWHVERAFRMSKTDLRIRPIFHRIRNRIEAHICISFTAYCVYKELERVLEEEKSSLSVKQAAELTHNMYQITYTLPESKHTKSKLMKMDEKQTELYNIIQEKFRVSQ
jgi:transposase